MWSWMGNCIRCGLPERVRSNCITRAQTLHEVQGNRITCLLTEQRAWQLHYLWQSASEDGWHYCVVSLGGGARCCRWERIKGTRGRYGIRRGLANKVSFLINMKIASTLRLIVFTWDVKMSFRTRLLGSSCRSQSNKHNLFLPDTSRPSQGGTVTN